MSFVAHGAATEAVLSLGTGRRVAGVLITDDADGLVYADGELLPNPEGPAPGVSTYVFTDAVGASYCYDRVLPDLPADPGTYGGLAGGATGNTIGTTTFDIYSIPLGLGQHTGPSGGRPSATSANPGAPKARTGTAMPKWDGKDLNSDSGTCPCGCGAVNFALVATVTEDPSTGLYTDFNGGIGDFPPGIMFGEGEEKSVVDRWLEGVGIIAGRVKDGGPQKALEETYDDLKQSGDKGVEVIKDKVREAELPEWVGRAANIFKETGHAIGDDLTGLIGQLNDPVGAWLKQFENTTEMASAIATILGTDSAVVLEALNILKDDVVAACETEETQDKIIGRVAAWVIEAYFVKQSGKALDDLLRNPKKTGVPKPKDLPDGLCFTSGALVVMSSGTKHIEDVQPGERVATPDTENDADTPTQVDPSTWRLVELRLPNSDCPWDVISLRLLRPLWWLAENSAAADSLVPICIEEMGLSGLATVTAVLPCPPIQPGRGRVVTGTVSHFNGYVWRLTFDGCDVEPTDVHPFYSLDRAAWVGAAALYEGERVSTAGGGSAVLEHKQRMPGIHRVYNLEVEGEHCFYVGERALLVHNQCAEKLPEGSNAPKTPVASPTPGGVKSPHIRPADVAGKTPAEIDALAKKQGLIPKGPDPMNGKGAYVDPVTGEQRVLIHGDHAHVNDPSGKRLDVNGNPVDPNTPDAHLPVKTS